VFFITFWFWLAQVRDWGLGVRSGEMSQIGVKFIKIRTFVK